MKRRIFLSSLAAASVVPSFSRAQQGTQSFTGKLAPPSPFVTESPSLIELKRPWGQVLRTFGDPVLEGHFCARLAVAERRLCLAMWDRGDRILGVGQSENSDGLELWGVVEAVLGRKPDITIGPGSYLFTNEHYETAHWHLDEVTGERLRRKKDAAHAQAASWMNTSRAIASSLKPLTRVLGTPPSGVSHLIWTEPSPEVPGGPKAPESLVLGSGENPEIERALRESAQTGRMIVRVEGYAASRFVERRSPLVPFTATLTNVVLPDGRPWGRFRILSV